MSSRTSKVAYLLLSFLGDMLFAAMAVFYVAQSAHPGAIVLLAVALLARAIVFWLGRRRFREAREAYLAAQRDYEEATRHRETAKKEYREALGRYELAKAEWEAEVARRSPSGLN